MSRLSSPSRILTSLNTSPAVKWRVLRLFTVFIVGTTTGCSSELGGPTQEAQLDSQSTGGSLSDPVPNDPINRPTQPANPDTNPELPANPRMTLPSCVATLFDFGSRCAGAPCHDNGPHSGSGLDLASPDVLSRLIDQPATHADVRDVTGCPQGTLLIDTANPTESWLLKKLDPNVDCGTVMPALSMLSSEEQTCLEDWILSF